MGNLKTLCQGAVSSNFRLAGPEQTYDDYRLCALGLVSEYLLPDLATALQVSPEKLNRLTHVSSFFRKDWALRRRKLPLDNSKDNLLAVKEMDLSRKRPSKKVMKLFWVVGRPGPQFSTSKLPSEITSCSEAFRPTWSSSESTEYLLRSVIKLCKFGRLDH